MKILINPHTNLIIIIFLFCFCFFVSFSTTVHWKRALPSDAYTLKSIWLNCYLPSPIAFNTIIFGALFIYFALHATFTLKWWTVVGGRLEVVRAQFATYHCLFILFFFLFFEKASRSVDDYGNKQINHPSLILLKHFFLYDFYNFSCVLVAFISTQTVLTYIYFFRFCSSLLSPATLSLY